MYERFGARETRDGKVEFKLFVPSNAKDAGQYAGTADPRLKTIHVVGSFQVEAGAPANWDPASGLKMEPIASPDPDVASRGRLYQAVTPNPLPPGFYEYKYYVTFQDAATKPRWVPDPCTRYGGASDDNSAIAVGGTRVGEVKALTNEQRRPMKDLVIYELMIDDFVDEYRGTRARLDAVCDRLDDLKALGFNAIEFMPWMDWVGHGFSWGYTPMSYFAVAYRYMNDESAPADKLHYLKKLIEACHERGLAVIMDGVFNHADAPREGSGFGYYWLYEDPLDCPYVGNFAGGGYARDLNFSNGCTHELVLDACRYWIDVFKIDGIRFDYTLGFYKPDDLQHGLRRLLGDLRAHLAARNIENFALILEHLSEPRYEAIGVMDRVGANGCWYERMRELAQASLHESPSCDLVRCVNVNESVAPGCEPVTYIESHDYTTLAWHAGRRSAWWRTQPMAIVLATAPGAVMVHNGQEHGEEYWFPDPVAPGRVEPRPLRWSTLGKDGVGAALRGVYRQLLHLRNAHSVLRAPEVLPRWQEAWARRPDPAGYGLDVDLGTLAFRRREGLAGGGATEAVVVVNFSGAERERWVDLPGPGTWRDVLNPGDAYTRPSGWVSIRVSSNWGRVLLRGP